MSDVEWSSPCSGPTASTQTQMRSLLCLNRDRQPTPRDKWRRNVDDSRRPGVWNSKATMDHAAMIVQANASGRAGRVTCSASVHGGDRATGARRDTKPLCRSPIGAGNEHRLPVLNTRSPQGTAPRAKITIAQPYPAHYPATRPRILSYAVPSNAPVHANSLLGSYDLPLRQLAVVRCHPSHRSKTRRTTILARNPLFTRCSRSRPMHTLSKQIQVTPATSLLAMRQPGAQSRFR